MTLEVVGRGVPDNDNGNAIDSQLWYFSVPTISDRHELIDANELSTSEKVDTFKRRNVQKGRNIQKHWKRRNDIKLFWKVSRIYEVSQTVWPEWAIYWTLGNFLKPLATINLPKSLTFLGKFL